MINDKVYIGQTVKNVKKRFIHHCSDARKGSNTHLHRAMRKYGVENFHIIEIEKVVADNIQSLNSKLNERETFYINQYNSMDNGYNLTLGGDGMLGYKHTEIQKKKLSDAWDDDRKDKMSKRVSGINNPQYGKKRPEISKRMSGANNHCSKSVICLNTSVVFDTLKEAANWCGLKSYSSIAHHLAGKHNSSGRHPKTGEKLVWEYKQEVVA